MQSFLIKYKTKIIGVYTDLEQAKLFINSCVSNNLMTESADILVYTTNSCYCIDTINITFKKEDIQIKENIHIKKEEDKIKNNKEKMIQYNKTAIKQPEINYEDPLFLKLADDKIILQHKINMLKVQKERIKESKEIYDNDIKLYSKFKENVSKDSAFIIPELFKEKFDLFKKLDEENKLSWESFVKEYVHSNVYSDFKLNSYDESFIKPDRKPCINEEFEIESDTESSCE
jgi:hypothetical protein